MSVRDSPLASVTEELHFSAWWTSLWAGWIGPLVLTVVGRDFAEHQKGLEAVLLALEKAKLTLNAKKCVFAANEISCLVHRSLAAGAVPNPNGVSAISEFPSPNDQPVAKRVKALRGFLEMVSFFRRYPSSSDHP